MFIKRKGFYVYRKPEGDDGGANGGGESGANSGTGETGGAAAAAAAGTAAGAKPADGAADGSLLAAGAKPETGTTDFIPEKLRVHKADGTLDLEASSRKLAEVYASAEKRIGSGDLPPKAAEEYAVTIPDAFKEAFNPEEDQGYKDFRAKAHEAGLTQKQMDLVMSSYFELAPQLVEGAQILDERAAETELKKTWATQADFDKNLKNSYTATAAIADKAGIPIETIMASPLKNDPLFLRMMAIIGPELREDKNPGGDILGGEDAVNDLMASDAYKDPKHKDHVKVSAQVRAYFEKKHGTEAAA